MNSDSLSAIWTARGLDKLAAQLAGGDAVTIKSIALGDGGGSMPSVQPSVTALYGEKWRGNVNTVEVDPNSSNSVIVEAVIPYNVGGWYIREWGLFDIEGDLIAYGPHAEFYKPVLESGTGAELLERIRLPVTSQSQVNMSVSSDVLATRDYVDRKCARKLTSWTLENDITAEGSLSLPEGWKYVVGKAQLLLFWEGQLLDGSTYDENGDDGATSQSVTLHFSVAQGDTMQLMLFDTTL